MGLTGDVKLGGRLFNVVNYDQVTTMNEHYVMKWMRQTGLDRVLPAAEGEDDAAYLMRLQGALIDTLDLPKLLGGYLLPAGKTETDWTPAMAGETAEYISKLQSKDDRAEVQRLGLLIVFDFFRVGIASLKHSQSVLEGTIPKPSPTTPSANRGPRAAH